ncbi:MAG: hypothetical protein ND866_29175 [Pyrinomonadaceae bacterium]|nr:hypothetical protein [Pyrinomonadaceae bacterium]
MNRSGSYILACMFLASTIGIAQAAEKSGAAKIQPGTFQVTISKGLVSLEANEAPLAKVFEEIGKRAGIAVAGNIGPAETVTMRLDKVPLEEGIRRLSNNVTILYGEKPNDKGHRITKIVVLSEDKRKAMRPQEVKAVKPSKASEPEPRPEPFRFEFDPTKSTKK